jgi:hypothetical protein
MRMFAPDPSAIMPLWMQRKRFHEVPLFFGQQSSAAPKRRSLPRRPLTALLSVHRRSRRDEERPGKSHDDACCASLKGGGFNRGRIASNWATRIAMLPASRQCGNKAKWQT